MSETADRKATAEQLSMLYTRYHFARSLAAGKDVLELACGAGFGLGYLAEVANRVVGTDVDSEFVQGVAAYFGNRIEVREVDATHLPFADQSFDLVLLLEAIYYLPDAMQCVHEVRRVLRSGGVLLVVSANPERDAFNPGAYTTEYFSASKLSALFQQSGLTAELFGGFPDEESQKGSALVHILRSVAVRLHLVPKTMRAKELLKRIFMGRLYPIPREVREGMAAVEPLVPLGPGQPATRFKVIYAVGRKRAA